MAPAGGRAWVIGTDTRSLAGRRQEIQERRMTGLNRLVVPTGPSPSDPRVLVAGSRRPLHQSDKTGHRDRRQLLGWAAFAPERLIRILLSPGDDVCSSFGKGVFNAGIPSSVEGRGQQQAASR